MEFENFYQINPNVSATTTPTLIPKFQRVKTDQFERSQDYVFDIVKSSQNYIVSLSNFQIQIFDQVEFKLQQKLNFHQDTINFIKTFDNFGFASGSSDGTVAIWDIRTGNQPSIVIKDPQQVPIISGDINKSSTLLATGGELSGEDAKINFYDLRSPQAPIHQFIESHQDDITQLLFHPIYENQLVSGSMDGLINLYDLKDFDEEEAIQTVLKFDQSISKLGFFGNQAEFLFSSSHMEHLRLWNLQSGDCISDFCDLKGYNFDNQFRMDYFINGHFDSLNERLFISGGDNSGRVGLIHVNLNSLQLCDVLDHGKEEIVRSVNWDQQSNKLIAGCEGGQLSFHTNDPFYRPQAYTVHPNQNHQVQYQNQYYRY